MPTARDSSAGGAPRPDGMRIVAAGSVLWQDDRRERLAVIHRHRYGDHCLPKGKVDPGEALLDCALRETREETGVAGILLGWAGELVYPVGGHDKSVVFFELVVDAKVAPGPTDAEEVADVLWLEPNAALATLTYDGERDLLADLLHQHGSG